MSVCGFCRMLFINTKDRKKENHCHIIRLLLNSLKKQPANSKSNFHNYILDKNSALCCCCCSEISSEIP